MQEAESLPEAAFTALTVALTNESELSVTFTSGRKSGDKLCVTCCFLKYRISSTQVSGASKNLILLHTLNKPAI